MFIELSWFCARAVLKILLYRILRSDLERQYFIALRENQILKRRKGKRVSVSQLDRLFFVSLVEKSRTLLSRLVVVQPETVMAWYRAYVQREIHLSNLHGRPPVPDQVVDLVIEMKRTNPRWGAGKIHGELLKLRIQLSERSVVRILKRAGLDPGNRKCGMGWLKFMRIHKEKIFACDFFTVPTVLFEKLHVFFLLDLKNRAIIHWCVVKDPTEEWLKNQLQGVLSELQKLPEYLVTDRDRKFGRWLKPFLKDYFGIKLFQIPRFKPWYNGFAERMVRTFREECLDQFLIFGERDLHRTLAEYVAYYNSRRPHSGMDYHSPLVRFSRRLRPLYSRSQVRRREVLGGVLSDYERTAA